MKGKSAHHKKAAHHMKQAAKHHEAAHKAMSKSGMEKHIEAEDRARKKMKKKKEY